MLTNLLPSTQSAGFPHKVANSLPQQLVSQFIVLLWNKFGVDNTKTIQMFASCMVTGNKSQIWIT